MFCRMGHILGGRVAQGADVTIYGNVKAPGDHEMGPDVTIYGNVKAPGDHEMASWGLFWILKGNISEPCHR
jgi:predicted acyltransferase (DUF342 family)